MTLFSWFFILPSLALFIGGMTAVFYAPGKQLTSMTQHFAAGVVFAAVAKELLPQIGAAHGLVSLLVGFGLGILTLFAAKYLSQFLEEKQWGPKSLSFSLVLAVWIDVFIDGLLIGIAFLAGEQGGFLITIALAIELLFLGLSTVATLSGKQAPTWYRLGVVIVLALTVPVSRALGSHFFAHASPELMNGILAFGVAALLYLVVEELLVEAHQEVEKIWMPLFFFGGFLLILLLEK